MKQLLLKILLIFLCIILFTGVIEATFRFKAEYLNYSEGRFEFRDGVSIEKDDLRISAEKGSLNRDDKIAVLEEAVNTIYEDGEITSEMMTARFEDEIYIFENNVNFVRKGENTDIILKSIYLEINQQEKTFMARDGVEINYNGRVLKSERANFTEEENILELFENVYIEEDDGWIRGQKAVFYVDDEEERFTVEDRVEIEMEL